jgi:hypothetical protein
MWWSPHHMVRDHTTQFEHIGGCERRTRIDKCTHQAG